ncbi:MAG: nucleotidyltransferase domain-containing protein [Candidatus Methanoperedens sp.]|nr:nucleotidyltransferase domain-containing protein [Candidatus Methanoperedens sp. BLZ2]MBZ0177097.1 nucleotidyltransferase domain-containing protein [Candidatus Methanoperedens nitroreducens]MCX9077528.1 nucleotidyltransferase domain-containing protein [Candidatus Methanoperedens sp.]
MQENIKLIIEEFKAKVQNLYGKRLKNIILYGSWARGDQKEHSDIDLAILLEGDVNPGKEIDRMINIITDLQMKYNALISVYPVSEKNYSAVKSPLLINIHKEGITA